MRHLGSLLLSLVLTAAWYVVLGLGLSQYFVKTAGEPGLTDKLVLAVAVLVAGALYGLTLLLRLSPLGLVISGLLLVILGFWRFFDATGKGPFAYLPTHIGSFPSSLTLPVEIAAFAGVPLLMTVFSPRRWRRYANPQPVASAYSANPPVPVNAPAGGYPPPGGYAAPGYGTPAADPYASPVSTPPADPYAAPVSPAGSGPDGTRMLPGQSSYQPSSGGPSYPPSSGGPSYPPPSSGAYPPPAGGPSYPPSGGPSYPPSGGAYPPPAGGPAYPPPASTPNPLWPGSPSSGDNDGDATRPI